MTIAAQLDEELKTAMRARDKDKVACIRQLRAKVQETLNSPKFTGEADDALYQNTIQSYVKSLKKGIVELAPAGEKSAALRGKYQAEIDYLDMYMPTLLDEAATRELVVALVKELGLSVKADTGRAMGALMKKHKGEVDAALLKSLLAEVLH